MSPSEFDLRAALREGEGSGPDPDALVASARAGAAARRTRIAAVSGAVVAVVAVGTTGAILVGRGGTSHRSAARVGASAGSAPVDGTGRGANAAPPNTSAASSAGTNVALVPGRNPRPGGRPGCPASFPTELIAGGGGTGQFGATGSLFAERVTSVLVCGYGSTGSTGAPGTGTLTGARASELVASLNTAASTRPTGACPDYRVADDHRYAFVGITSGGTGLPAVTTTLGQPACTVRVTNGTAIRYAWSVPVDLASSIDAVQPK